MELRHIRYFLAIAEEGHFTRAARKLGIAQPPLSAQIKSLENEIGAPLFHRVPQGAELTVAGTVFRDRVQAIPGLVQAAIRDTRRAANGETGLVRVGFTGSAAFNHRVPDAIRTFRRTFPDVELTLEEDNSNGLVAGLHSGRLDAAFIRPESIDKTGLRVYRLEEEPLIAAVPSGRAFESAPIALAELAADPFILTPRTLGPTLFDQTLAACRTAGFEPIMGQSAPQVASVLALVAAELGVALVPQSMRDAAIKGVSYFTLQDSAAITLALARRESELAPAVLSFISQVRFPE